MMIDDEQPTRWLGTKTHPYAGDASSSKVPAQNEFTAISSSSVVPKAVPADAGLKLLAAAMRNRARARGCLKRIVMMFVVFCWMLYSCNLKTSVRACYVMLSRHHT